MYRVPFIPPPDMRELSKEEIESLKTYKLSKEKRAYIHEKYEKPLQQQERKRKRKRRAKWWRDNWISFTAMIFAFIAAVPYIIQGIETILKWLGLLN